MTGLLDLHAIARRAAGHDILTDVTLSLIPSEVLGLIGPNGSGKSTLMSIMAGLTLPCRGRVMLDGLPMAGLRRRQIARRIAYVAQHSDTSDRITVREAVELGRTPWLGPLRPFGPDDDAAVAEALRVVGMDHLPGRDWSSLSGGERQRVNLARAHAQSPDILLLDEPTNHLDIHHQLAILDLIRSLPVTTVIALHDLNHAMRCDRVLVMAAGRAVALGPPDHVLTPDLIGRVFNVDARLIARPDGTDPVFAFRRLT